MTEIERQKYFAYLDGVADGLNESRNDVNDDTGLKLDEAIERYTSNAEFERNHGSLQGCLEFRQLVEWLTDYKRLLEQQPSDTVSRGAFEQVMWERDVAIGQLKELGYELGQKVEPCDDAISRQAVLEKAINVPIAQIVTEDEVICRKIVFVDDIENLPPVTPQQKYGKWINKDRYYHDTITAECSECCREVEIPTCMEELMYGFCPICGKPIECNIELVVESEEV